MTAVHYVRPYQRSRKAREDAWGWAKKEWGARLSEPLMDSGSSKQFGRKSSATGMMNLVFDWTANLEEDNFDHDKTGIRWWSPTQLLIGRREACVQSIVGWVPLNRRPWRSPAPSRELPGLFPRLLKQPAYRLEQYLSKVHCTGRILHVQVCNHNTCKSLYFFFKRNEPDRGNARRLIPTITKELIKQNKDLASGVLKAIEHNPQIDTKDVTEQFNKLLLEPLKNVAMYPSRTLFLSRVQEPSSMRLKIFLTSRPELPLRRFFEKESSHQGLILEKIAEEAIKEDIMRFLEHRFAEIRRQAKIGKDWPGDEVLEALATACMPLFISAATICRFIEQSGEDPVKHLADILKDQRRYMTKIDKTYGPIFDRILRERDKNKQEKQVTRFKRIFGVIILLSVPLPINALSEFVGISARSVKFLLDSFHSVLRIPDEQDLPVRILHPSFREYLLTTQSRFHVDEGLTHNDMTSHYLRVINQHLKRDICDLQSFGIQHEDIDDKIIRQFVPPHLQYSCRYWVFHLAQSKSPLSKTEVLSFLKAYFLHWLEVMSLTGVISETVDMMKTLQSRTYSEDNSEYSEFLIDAHRFILQNIQMANGAPLQLYASGLASSAGWQVDRVGVAGAGLLSFIKYYSREVLSKA
ncbi:hypothetical protein P170DRAFT_426542 [Aspergillus steynii IBT 23096]|uniref:Nephrocystin 3-like N-terminal domain-containing protein n=1 Tax=Aspergillus steynii IBT 23096 TaxID=1392250 RepID=A0A2I2G9V9_9EURO|nr:uncharacterized protein P170DRAFT_426542 [Aspergillus steynii IBT 23096]PLB49666.1 hypothetical protein P170DRAFT_426542 [Aspergillus steynii IBT 23096]